MKPPAPSFQSFEIVRIQCGQDSGKTQDDVAVEEPLEIRLENRPVSITMRTPGHDAELASGFLFTEGILRSWSDVLAIQSHPRNQAGNVINVFLRPEVSVDWNRLQRNVYASSSCGLCGKATLESIRQLFPPIDRPMKPEPEVLQKLPEQLRDAQSVFARTGGLHAAALFTKEGKLISVREDVGRHNALDKVLGEALRSGRVPLSDQILLVSGRVSFEIMQKALAGGIPVIAGISAPTSLAIECARANHQMLAGFLRNNRMNIYHSIA